MILFCFILFSFCGCVRIPVPPLSCISGHRLWWFCFFSLHIIIIIQRLLFFWTLIWSVFGLYYIILMYMQPVFYCYLSNETNTIVVKQERKKILQSYSFICFYTYCYKYAIRHQLFMLFIRTFEPAISHGDRHTVTIVNNDIV